MTISKKITTLVAGSAMALTLMFAPALAPKADAAHEGPTVQIPVETLQKIVILLQTLSNNGNTSS